MGLFDRLKKEKSANDIHRERSISDIKVPTAFAPIKRPDFPDAFVSDGVKFKKAYYYDSIPARLFGSLPSSRGQFGFSSDGKYLLFDDKRIASVQDRSDMIRDFISRGEIVLVTPCAQAGSDLQLAAAFYKKALADDTDLQAIEITTKVSSADSYYSCDELRGIVIDDIRFAPDCSFSLYSGSVFIAPLSDAKADRIASLEHDGYLFSGGKVTESSAADSGLSYVLRIRLEFL